MKIEGVVTSEIVNFGGSVLETPATNTPTPQKKSSDSVLYAKWGEDNLYPQQIIELVEKTIEPGSLIDWKIKLLHGSRLRAVLRTGDTVTEVEDEDIVSFLNLRTTKRWWRESVTDLIWFSNVFTEIVKSEGDKIAQINTQDASYCRYEKMQKGFIKKCYVNANWETIQDVKDDLVLTYDVIDPYQYNVVDQVRKASFKSFIYPHSAPSPGRDYYQRNQWDGLRVSQWLDLMIKIPILKNAFLGKSLNVVFNIKVRDDLWEKWFKDWKKKNDKEKAELKQKWLDAMNKKLCGQENAGSSIITDFAYDPSGKLIDGIIIEAIKNPFVDGQWLKDTAEGSSYTMRAFGVDDTLVGSAPGSTVNAGSGSDKLIAIQIYEAMQQFPKEILLEPLYFIAEYNGWLSRYPNLEFQAVGLNFNFGTSTSRPIGQKGAGNAAAN